jgi:ubiquinone/menaquinone biosynthesis C-methylase UbiE
MPESTFKRHLVTQAGIKSDEKILDLGCGTATLTIFIKRMHPDATVMAIDGDPKILEIGRSKAAKANMNITFAQAMSFELPYTGESIDRVLTSLMFHHLTLENKVRSLKEIYRVLRSGGELHIADFGKPQNLLMRVAAYPWQLFDGSGSTADHVEGLLPTLMSDSGFVEVRESRRYMTLFGTLSLYAGRKA